MKIIGNGRLITRNNENPLIDNGAVVVEGNLVKDFGTTQDILEKYKNEKHEYLDVKGQVIMPGLINTHMHIYSAFARGMNIEGAPVNKDFDDILENLWWKLDKVLNMEDVKYSAYATYIDCIKNGVTTVFDHHASQNAVTGSLFQIADVAKELGIRTNLCYEVTDRDGEQRTKEAIKENIDFIKHANNDKTDMIKGMLGLHASFTVSDKTLDMCVDEMGSLNAGFHVHTAEGINDTRRSLRDYGKRVVNRFYDKGILGEKSIAVHCIHINNEEMDILKDTNTIVVHNPESNMGNAVGCQSTIKLMEKDIMLGLGTDGYTGDMYESLKVGNIIHKHNLNDPAVAWGEIPTMLFENNRTIANRFFDTPLGTIKKDAAADIVVVDYDPLTPLTEGNMNSHILFGMQGRMTTTTMINGEFVMKDRELLVADEKEIFHKSRIVCTDFWKRINS
ncbi:MAG: putative aminohydrolase SsnA [Lachnospirales bacterium]